MSGWRILGQGVMAVGIVLLAFGIQVAYAFSDETRSQLAAQDGERTAWYIVAGLAGLILGSVLALLGGRARHKV